MNEQHLDGRETPNEKNLWQCSGWLLVASLVISAMLLATNHRHWTDIAPWLPQTFVVVFAAYAWSFLRWIRWGERRRARGDGSLFGPKSQVGATAASHSLLFHTAIGGAICLISGFATASFLNGNFGFTSVPILMVALPSIVDRRQPSVYYVFPALIAFPLTVMPGHLLVRFGLSSVTTAVSLGLLALASLLLIGAVGFQARSNEGEE